mmetsp:Transcript_1575/g.2390  ORF Transcript_1575/g.2390 Transcript_1575/m.2390 type:complete len:234 (+) Transcript_1575:63-764(+)
MSRWGRKQRIPKGFDVLEPTLSALQEELRNRTNESHEGKSKAESLWPIHQLNWQRSRYVYDMYYKYKKINREVYQYCLDMKYADAALIAKWKKPGYERLCSTYAINPKNFPYGTVSICRVPRKMLKDKGIVKSNFSGCIGCASGKNGFKNIFGNKYGQRLAKIQILREQAKAKLEEEMQEKHSQEERLMKLKEELQQKEAEAAKAKDQSNLESEKSTAAPSTWTNNGGEKKKS